MPKSFDYLMALDLETDLKKTLANGQDYLQESEYLKIEQFI